MAVVVVEAQRRAEARGLHLEPDVAQPLGAELAGAALFVDLGLEGMQRDLAHHGVEHVLDLGGQHDLAAHRVGLGLEQRLEGQHLAEHRGGLGQRERRVGQEVALRAREHLVAAMAELVRQGHDVAHLALVVHQQIGVRARHGRVRERARRLAGPRRRVDPRLVEELLSHRGKIGRERAVGPEHDLARLVPRDQPVRRLGQRRVAVPVVERLDAEPARLERVVAVRQPAVIVLHRGDQRVDDLVLDPVRQIAR